MLLAHKEYLKADLKTVSLSIRDQELQWYEDTLGTLTTLSTLVFASAGGFLNNLKFNIPKDTNQYPLTVYQCFTVSAMVLQLLSLLVSVLACQYGPHLALRGPDGSVSLALNSFEFFFKLAVVLFWVGLFAILLAFVGYMWCFYAIHDSILDSILVLAFCSVIVHISIRVRNEFKLECDIIENGKLQYVLDPELIEVERPTYPHSFVPRATSVLPENSAAVRPDSCTEQSLECDTVLQNSHFRHTSAESSNRLSSSSQPGSRSSLAPTRGSVPTKVDAQWVPSLMYDSYTAKAFSKSKCVSNTDMKYAAAPITTPWQVYRDIKPSQFPTQHQKLADHMKDVRKKGVDKSSEDEEIVISPEVKEPSAEEKKLSEEERIRKKQKELDDLYQEHSHRDNCSIM